MSRTTFTIAVDAHGRLTLPAEALAALEAAGGAELRLDIEDAAVTLRPAGAVVPPSRERMENAFDGYTRQLTASLSPAELQVFMGNDVPEDFDAVAPTLPDEDDFEPEPVPMTDDELSFIRGLLSGRD